MPTFNLSYVRACAEQLGAKRETISKLEKAEYRETQEWDEHQASRFWGRLAVTHFADLGLASSVKAQRGDRVLNMNALHVFRPWTVVQAGPKRLTLERDGERTFADPSLVATRLLVPFAARHEPSVVGFVTGYFARNAIDSYSSMTGLAQFVAFHAELQGLLLRLDAELDPTAAIDAVRRYKGQQPRSWVRGQILRNGYSEEQTERILREHFD